LRNKLLLRNICINTFVGGLEHKKILYNVYIMCIIMALWVRIRSLKYFKGCSFGIYRHYILILSVDSSEYYCIHIYNIIYYIQYYNIHF